MRTRAFGIWLLVSLGTPLVAFGQVVKVPAQTLAPPESLPAPPTLEVAELTLSEAVELALGHNPEILRAKQDVAFSMGRYQEARGLFDPGARVSPGYSYTAGPIRPFVLAREQDKRSQLEEIRDGFLEVHNLLNDALREMIPRPPRCPPGLEFISFSEPFVLDRLDSTEAGITGVEQDLRGTELGLDGFQISDICVPATDFGVPPDVFIDFWSEVNRINNLGIDNIVDGLTEFQGESVASAAETAEAVTTRAALARQRLGDLPADEIRKAMFLEASYFHPLRNGMQLSADMRLSSDEQSFLDKSLDPVFGGFEFNVPFTSFVSVTLETPLGKGRGRASAQAPERAAELTLEGQRELLRHTITTEVFRTVLAYLNLMASQRALELLSESADRQRQFLDITQQLIDADELPAVELERANARAATVYAGVNNGRLSVLAARLSLAQMMGIDVEELQQAPSATSDFPSDVATVESVDNLTRRAIAGRHDLKALSSIRDSSRVISEAARLDLKRRYDFSATFGLSPLYTSPFFRFLPDEAQPIETYETLPPPEDSPLHYYSPTGYWRMFNAEWQPFVNFGINFELPFANNVAEGRALQAQSSFRRSDIQRTDLGRVVYENVVEVARSLGYSEKALAARRNALDFYRQTLEGAQEQYRTGDITLFDTLVTEEDLTRESLELISDLQSYYSLLARLRFEVGQLVQFENVGDRSEAVVFDPSGLIVP